MSQNNLKYKKKKKRNHSEVMYAADRSMAKTENQN